MNVDNRLWLLVEMMRAFQIVQDIHKIFGIYPADHLDFIKILVFISSRITSFTSSLAYFTFKANSIDEYGETYYVCATCAGVLLSFITLLLKMNDMSQLIRKFREVVFTSEWITSWKITKFRNRIKNYCHFNLELNDQNSKAIFYEIIEQMDQMADRVHFVLIKITFPVILIADPLMSAVNFFILDFGQESFVMSAPLLYVWTECFLSIKFDRAQIIFAVISPLDCHGI